MEERRIALSRGTLVYLEHGIGPTLLFLHGGVATPRAYIPLIELLGQQFRVIAPTHPGHGDSFKLSRGWKLEDFVATYHEFFDTLALPPIPIVSHSFGGTIAYLLAHAGYATKLYSFAPTGLPFILTPRAYLAAKKKEAKELLAYVNDRERVAEALSGAETLLYTAVHHPENIPWIAKRVPTIDLSRELSALTIPVSLFWGEDDGIVPLSVGEQMHTLIAGSTLTVFPGKGHTYPVTDPEFTYRKLQKVLGV